MGPEASRFARPDIRGNARYTTMKTKVARKAMRHAKPFRKVTRGKKQARAAATPNKKEVLQNLAAEPEIIAATFEAPIGFVEVDLEPVVDVFEVIEVAVPGIEGEE
jgi:hypothetical protein